MHLQSSVLSSQFKVVIWINQVIVVKPLPSLAGNNGALIPVICRGVSPKPIPFTCLVREGHPLEPLHVENMLSDIVVGQVLGKIRYNLKENRRIFLGNM